MLITPDGSAPALRLRYENVLPIVGGGTKTWVSYEYLTEGTVSARIYQQATVSYSVTQANATNAVEDVPRSFSLDQNYPNPFSGSTTISFRIDKPGLVSLSILDLLGREVLRPVNGVMSAGKQTTNIDASDLASGVYVYRLETDGSSIVKQFILDK